LHDGRLFFNRFNPNPHERTITMKKRACYRAGALMLVLILVLTGCASTSDTGSQTSQWLSSNEKALIGGLGAATAGGLLGAAFHLGPAGIIGGALLGGLAGGAIGNRMDAADKQQQAQAAQRAFETTPSGQSVAWRNPDTGNSGTLTPMRTYQASSGQYCREYQQTITVGGEKQQAYGTTCRQPDGSWKIVS
jgi:surface antigen